MWTETTHSHNGKSKAVYNMKYISKCMHVHACQLHCCSNGSAVTAMQA